MKRARFATNRATAYAEVEINKSTPRPAYICSSCETPVTLVQGYRLPRGGFVQPLFRLSKNANHDPGCLFDVHGTLTRAFAQSRPFAQGQRVISKQPLTLRLEVLLTLLQQARRFQSLPENITTGEKRVETFLNTERQLTPYLRGAADIIRLMAAIDDYADLSRELNLVFQRNALPWARFAYDQTRITDLFQRLEIETINHPVFTIFRPQTIIPRYGYPVLGCRYIKCLSSTGHVIYLSPQISFTTRNLAMEALQYKHIAVVGVPHLLDRPYKKHSDGTEYRPIRFDIAWRPQICEA